MAHTFEIRRSVLLASLFTTVTSAFAAAPDNDNCSGAQVIPAAGPFPHTTPLVPDITDATSEGDPPVPTCQSLVSRSVWYTFTPVTSGRYVFSTCAEAPTGSTVDDTVLAVYTSATGCAGPFTEVGGAACDDDGCGFEDNQSSLGVSLQAGTVYYVLLYKYGTSAPFAGNTAVQMRVFPSFPPPNDTCQGATALALNIPASGSTQTATNDYELPGSAACFSGLNQTATTAAGRDVVYRYTPAASGNYSFRVKGTGASSDTALYVATTCPSGASPATVSTCTAASNRSALYGEEVACTPLTQGTPYFAFVDAASQTSGGTFELEVTACFPEAEPNDTPAQANTFVCGMQGSLQVPGDVDFFSLGSATGRVFAMVDGYTGADSDFDLRVTTTTHTVEYDDDNNNARFGDNAPNISGALLSVPGFLRVSHYFAGTAQEPYRVYAVVQPDSAQATAEVEPNEAPDEATSAANLYFSGTLSGFSPSTDIDVFRVTANAGDLLFVALDADPLRNETPLNGKLELMTGTGEVLVSVNDIDVTSVATDAGATLTANVPRSPGEALTYRVPVGGTFYVRVSSGVTIGSGGAGDYLLSISKNCFAGGPTGPAPSLSQVSPSSGTANGGTSVILSGAQFVNGATVSFGSTASSNVTFNSPSSLTVLTPVHAPQMVNVTVRNPDSQAATLNNAFTFTASAPTVTAVAPAVGPSTGGTSVVVTGTSFYPGAAVSFGGTAAPVVVVSSSTSLMASTPPHAAGTVAVVVQNTDGQQGSQANAFTFQAQAPTVTQVSPAMGSTLGGTAVSLTGTGFQNGAAVLFGGTAAAMATVVSPTSIDVSTPAHAVGLVTVEVRNPDNQSGQKTQAFTFIAPPAPTVTQVTPNTGPSSGDTRIIVTGQGFAPGAVLTVGGGLATQVNIVSDVFIEALTPAHAAGQADVVVTNPDQQAGSLAKGFTYVGKPAPVINVVVPVAGPTMGGTVINLTGGNFENGSTVALDGYPCTDVNVVSVSTITCQTPAHSAGAVDVVVTNPDSQTGKLASGFTFEGPDVDAGPRPDAGHPDAGVVDAGMQMPSDAGMAAVDGGTTTVEVRQGCGCNGTQAAPVWLALAGVWLLRWRRRSRHA